MAQKKEESAVFEIVVVLAIVAIVALTGQVLLNLETTGSGFSLGEGITGFAVADEDTSIPKEPFIDVGVADIEVDPQSPLVGEPFSVKITVANEGFEKISTPFYIEAKIMPNVEGAKPTKIYNAVTQSLNPGEKASVMFNIAMVTAEGPVRIIATSDYTFKLGDNNPSNDVRSKTIVISSY
ncbi:hypothetical protein JXB28_05255 [Candidatus Woesearchaeota archaeon]|nr:hypothetical protein [Candidatus Woesearchaeota archaeon]